MADRIRQSGPIRFDEVMGLALYHPEHGFYARAHAGRRGGHFITSPEVGPLFGAVLARALGSAGTIVEAGAGRGTLARAVLVAAPDVRYVAIEQSPRQRVLHPDGVESRADFPSGDIDVIVANELLDNLPVRLIEGDAEVYVGLDTQGQLAEVLAAAPPELASAGGQGRVPIQAAASAWLRDALDRAPRVVVIDYCSPTTAALADRPVTEWLRTYRAHRRGSPPLADLGEQDITCEVAVDQLAEVRPPTADTAQAEWLRQHGLDDLVDEGRRVWSERSHLGDLAAIRGRSRITEAAALTDPAGLGAFRVLEWTS